MTEALPVPARQLPLTPTLARLVEVEHAGNFMTEAFAADRGEYIRPGEADLRAAYRRKLCTVGIAT